MNTVSLKKLEKYLNEYLVYLEYWDEEQGDSHLMFGAREILQNQIRDLTDDQLEQLDTLDEQAIELLDNYHGKETHDVWNLRQCVELAHQKEGLFA